MDQAPAKRPGYDCREMSETSPAWHRWGAISVVMLEVLFIEMIYGEYGDTQQ